MNVIIQGGEKLNPVAGNVKDERFKNYSGSDIINDPRSLDFDLVLCLKKFLSAIDDLEVEYQDQILTNLTKSLANI